MHSSIRFRTFFSVHTPLPRSIRTTTSIPNIFDLARYVVKSTDGYITELISEIPMKHLSKFMDVPNLRPNRNSYIFIDYYLSILCISIYIYVINNYIQYK